MERAEVALTEEALKRSKPAISRIAGITAQNWGSARYALDLFREAAIVSEAILSKDHISQEAVEEAQKILETNVVEEQIRCLPPQPFAVLDAVYRLRMKKGLYTGDVYSKYEAICHETGLPSFSQRRVSDIITELDATGRINCRLVSMGRLGLTRLISWPTNPALDKVYEKAREKFL